jgi:CDP-diacylglycerol pyrophosphatase
MRFFLWRKHHSMTVKIIRGGSVLAALLLFVSWAVHAANADALWNIVHEQCVPHWQQAQDPAPCARVETGQGEAHGFAVLKDIHGVLQYLLIPTARVSGIESPLLLQDDAPDYWAAAWEARQWMERLRGSPLPREALALTVNSQWGRSQNQLHIHVSCVRPALSQQLQQAAIGPQWQELPGGINGHGYQARAIMGETLAGVQPFRLLAEGIPAAREDMGRYTLAVIATRFDSGPGFWLLAGKADLLAGNFASAEGDVQDHDCQLLQSMAAP